MACITCMHGNVRMTFARLVGMLVLPIVATSLNAQQPPPSDQSTTQTADDNDLWKTVNSLHDAGELAAAIATAENLLARQRKAKATAEIDETLEWLAKRYLDNSNLQASRKAWQELLENRTKQHGGKHWQVIETRLRLEYVDKFEKLPKGLRRRLKQASQQNLRVNRLWEQGKYRLAIPIARDVWQIRQKILGADHWMTAISESNLADHLAGDNQVEESKERFEHAMAVQRQVFGEKHPETAITISSLARVLTLQRDLEGAKRLYLQSRDIFAELEDRQHDLAVTLSGLAGVHALLDEYEDAESLAKQAIQMHEHLHGPAHRDTAVAKENLAVIYMRQEKYRDADRLIEDAVRVSEELLGDSHPQTVQARQNLAFHYQRTGRYPESLIAFSQVMQLIEKDENASPLSIAISQHNLGVAHYHLGRLAEAERLVRTAHDAALGLGAKGESLAIATAGALVGVYNMMGDYALAENIASKSIEVAERSEDTKEMAPMLRNNLAEIYRAKDDYVRAEAEYMRILEPIAQPGNRENLDYIQFLHNLAGVQTKMKKFGEAERNAKRAHHRRKEVLGENHFLTATSKAVLAELYLATGDPRSVELARQSYETTYDLLKENHPSTANSAGFLADVYLTVGKPAAAGRHARMAVDVMLRHMRATMAAQSERQQLLLSKNLRGHLDRWLSIAHNRVPPREQYEHVLKWKGATHIWQAQARKSQKSNPEVAKLWQEWRAVAGALSAHVQQGLVSNDLESWQQKHERLFRKQENLEKDLSRAGAHLLTAGIDTTTDDVLSCLPSDVALIDFLEYELYQTPPEQKGEVLRSPQMLAFILRPGREVVRVELGPIEPIEQLVEQWRSANQQMNLPALAVCQRLRQAVWDPLVEYVADSQTILYSPDGAICRLPLDAVPSQQSQTYLIEEHAFAVVPVPSLLPNLLTKVDQGVERQPSLLLIGDVDYQGDPGRATITSRTRAASPDNSRADSLLAFGRLDGTVAEALVILDKYKEFHGDVGARELRDSAATESAFRELAPQFRWLHLATHGFFAPPELRSRLAISDANPQSTLRIGDMRLVHPGLLSGVALAGASAPMTADGDDGILTALEVAGLDLANTELIVLSACNTGLGPIAGGEGVLGLQRAFQISGAESTVTTLWDIKDDGGEPFMRRFYQNHWGRKMTRLDALRAAKLEILREVNRNRRIVRVEAADDSQWNVGAPAYEWAGFVLAGDWR